MLGSKAKAVADYLFIDIFAHAPALTFDGKSTHRTFIGCIFTYTVIVLSILATISFSEEMIWKQNPNVIITERTLSVDDKSPKITFTKPEMSIAFGILEDSTLIEIDPSYFNITADLVYFGEKDNVGDFEKIHKSIDIISCPYERIPKSFLKENMSITFFQKMINFKQIKPF